MKPSGQPILHFRTYACSPDAEWVVFVHGAGGSSALWFRQVREFQSHFNLLLVDLRGHGDSGKKAPLVQQMKYTFEDVSRDLLDVMDHAGIERAHFVGMSLGSIIIRTLAEAAPERVQSMVLGGAILRLNFRSRVLIALGNLTKRFIPYLWLYRLFAWVIMPHRRNREARTLFTREARKLKHGEFLRWFRMTWRINPILRLFNERELPVPVLYLMGEEDHMFLPAVRRVVQQHRRSILQVVERAGHVCNIEAPELFNRYAIAFIRKNKMRPAAG